MYRYLVLFLALAGCAHASAQPNASSASPFNINVALNETAQAAELTIHVEDAEEVSNACDYYVRRLEYVEALRTLMVDVEPQFCQLDRMGRRKASFKWIMPHLLRATGKLCLVVNQKKIGVASFSHSVNAVADFRADSNEVCQ
jgi:hypothetical protein